LIADSVSCFSFFRIIKGRKDIKFNSSPNHTVNQLCAVKAIMVPENKEEKNRQEKGNKECIKVRIELNYSNLG